MKFLLDVNAGTTSADLLTQQGHDVIEVTSKDPKMTDQDILNWALSEERIIVTTDKDFEEMIWRQRKKHCGILRLENLPRKERLKLLRDALKRCAKDLEAGAIVIASTTKYRVRKLP